VLSVYQPEVMIGDAAQRFDSGGNLVDESAKTLIRQLLQSLVDWTQRIQALDQTSKVNA
jgi:chromate reductase